MNLETAGQNGKVKPAIHVTYSPLVKADQKKLIEVWPRVRLGCLAVKARVMEIAEKTGNRNVTAPAWDIKHIRSQLELGLQGKSTAELWLVNDEKGRMRGFLVTIVANCPYLNVPQSLICWIAHTFEPIPGRLARGVLRQLENYAKGLGLENVDGYSVNPKWDGWLHRYGEGYSPIETLFRKRLW